MSGHRRKDTLAWLVLGDKLAFFARMTLDRLNIALLKVQAHCPRLKRLTPRLPCAVLIRLNRGYGDRLLNAGHLCHAALCISNKSTTARKMP